MFAFSDAKAQERLEQTWWNFQKLLVVVLERLRNKKTVIIFLKKSKKIGKF